jgi:bacteriorhodopsin
MGTLKCGSSDTIHPANQEAQMHTLTVTTIILVAFMTMLSMLGIVESIGFGGW